jgi:choline dehydrogenase-like flavoprotein
MLIDARALEAGSVLRAEFCVVGSGMGGSAVATKLARAGRDVVIVEAGGTESADEQATPIAGEHVGRPFGLPATRCVELGGGSNRWHGICGQLDEIDFERRPWINDSGWPIGASDLARHWEGAASAFGVTSAHAVEMGDTDARVRGWLTDIRVERSVLQNKLTQVREPALRWKDTLLRLAREKTLRCVINAPALELIPDENGRIEAMVVGAGTVTVTVRAKVYVVCAGALETPRLLLNSRARRPEGIGNTRDLVGRCLLDHPIGHFCKLEFARKTQAPLYASMRLGPVHLMAGLMLSPRVQRAHRLANHYLWIRPSVSPARIDDELLASLLAVQSARDLSLGQIAGIIRHRDILYRILVRRLGLHPSYRYGDLFFMTEQVPNRNSRVQLSEWRRDVYGYPTARIAWQLSDTDLKGFERYTRLLFGQGLTSDQYRLARVDEPPVWARTVTSAAHHLGTARMADHPTRGVVDRHLKVFGTRNLFVCDGSVFPTAGSINPSLTIAALGLRLGEHLTHHVSTAVHVVPVHRAAKPTEAAVVVH